MREDPVSWLQHVLFSGAWFSAVIVSAFVHWALTRRSPSDSGSAEASR